MRVEVEGTRVWHKNMAIQQSGIIVNPCNLRVLAFTCWRLVARTLYAGQENDFNAVTRYLSC
jgi:hypothetical protein